MEPMLNELRHEAETTKRLLDRVPADELEWRPHPKSMSLGQLALHVASIPGDLTRLAQLDEFDAAKASFEPAMPESKAMIITALNKAYQKRRSIWRRSRWTPRERRGGLHSVGVKSFRCPAQ